MICRRHSFHDIPYPVNLDVPQESLSLGDIIKKFDSTGVLNAPIHDASFQYEGDENGPIIPEGSKNFPTSYDKTSAGLEFHESLTTVETLKPVETSKSFETSPTTVDE